MKLNRRWRIVFIASFLAFLMEYSLRGIHIFAKEPLMALVVFANYFTYLAIIEELIGRYKLKDYQVWIVAQFFALLWQLISVSAVYYPPYILGINVFALLINNLIWWTTMQTVFALYIARRLAPRVDRNRPLLRNVGLAFFVCLFLLVTVSFRLFATPPVTPWQLLVMLMLTSTFAFLSLREFRKNKGIKPAPFKSVKLYDGLGIFLVIYLLFSFFFLTGGEGLVSMPLINPAALKANLIISPIIALTLLIRRIKSKTPISV